ncbi:FecR family protein [Sphingosinicella soli]|uniref:Transmembrane sensor n=1 Tax=Sphingosinicella soli TaxID=333708 RepID=A0A7W7B271_9SPHN|nr:FecR domain-containing protein [Sphingosinicella soli]MBB4632650.1 transmembrane sensor [Sphingosinicella soli]
MASNGVTNGINEEAVRWAVELAYGEMTAEDEARLEAWLAADTRHRGAFARARAWMRATDDAVAGASHESWAEGPGLVSRRRSVFARNRKIAPGVAALAACLVAIVSVGGPALLSAQRSAHAPAREVVKLNDGSVATLSADANIEVALSADHRRVTLLAGEATFQVAKDKARPFVVRSGDVYAQATGTTYSVRRMGPTGGTIKVTEGSVLVWPRDERDQAVLLQAGGMVTLDPGPKKPSDVPTASASPQLPPPELAQISLDNVSIKSAVARFNRVNSTKIVITDPAIEDMTIIGLYKANDPEQFAHAVAAVAGGSVEHGREGIVINSKSN